MSSTQEVGDIFSTGLGPSHAMLRSPTVLIVSIGLWGMNIFFFRLFGINYRYVLQYDLLKEQQQQQLELKEQKQESLATLSMSIPAAPVSSGSMASIGDMSITTTPVTSRKDDKTSSRSFDESDLEKEKDKDNLNLAVKDKYIDKEMLYLDSQYPALEASTTAGATITWYKLVIFSLILLFLLHATTRIWMDLLGRGVVGAVLCFYATFLIYIFIPLASNQWLRKAFQITLLRTFALIQPRCWCFRPTEMPRPIPFVDVFYADAMCSLSKVFFDWGMLLHMASHYPNPVPQAAHNIIIPSLFAALPFVIRARQCLLMWSIGRLKKDPNRYQHVANAIKYSTSIWPLLLSAYQKTMEDTVAAQSLNIYLILLQTVNALYALYWDIVMDWGMMQNPQAVVAQACISTTSLVAGSGGGDTTSKSKENASDHRLMRTNPCHHVWLRPRLRFGLTMSALIVLADAILRFSWLLRFVSSYLFVSHDAFVLCTQFLEVFRRSIWNLLRVEWENIKQKSKQLKARDSLSDTEDDEDRYDTMDSEMIGLLVGNTNNNNINNTTTTNTMGPTSTVSGQKSGSGIIGTGASLKSMLPSSTIIQIA